MAIMTILFGVVVFLAGFVVGLLVAEFNFSRDAAFREYLRREYGSKPKT
jgi:uncharacterized protein YneF (UPF0154 family)